MILKHIHIVITKNPVYIILYTHFVNYYKSNQNDIVNTYVIKNISRHQTFFNRTLI